MSVKEFINMGVPWGLTYCGRRLEELSKEELIEACKAIYQMYESAWERHQSTLRVFKMLGER